METHVSNEATRASDSEKPKLIYTTCNYSNFDKQPSRMNQSNNELNDFNLINAALYLTVENNDNELNDFNLVNAASYLTVENIDSGR